MFIATIPATSDKDSYSNNCSCLMSRRPLFSGVNVASSYATPGRLLFSGVNVASSSAENGFADCFTSGLAHIVF